MTPQGWRMWPWGVGCDTWILTKATFVPRGPVCKACKTQAPLREAHQAQGHQE